MVTRLIFSPSCNTIPGTNSSYMPAALPPAATPRAQPPTRDLLVLELEQLVVDLLDVDVDPRDVLVAADLVEHVVVQLVELLQQVELLADALDAVVLGDGQAEQLLAARVRLVLRPHLVEAHLVDVEPVGRLARRDAVHHRAPGGTPRSVHRSVHTAQYKLDTCQYRTRPN